jgi:hypothetical protein
MSSSAYSVGAMSTVADACPRRALPIRPVAPKTMRARRKFYSSEMTPLAMQHQVLRT